MPGDPRAQWAALGQPRPRSLTLPPAARARLAHLAELRDVASPSDAARVGAELASERWLAPDLLAARPWLPPHTPAREVPEAVLHSEWTGFLALLGEYGPWVYAASVADLQRLSRLYSRLVSAASCASEATVLAAALAGCPLPSLLARLEETDYRTPAAAAPTAPELAALELAFWQEVQAQAGTRRAAWLARRRT